MYQILIQHERGDSIFDFLFGIGCGLLNGSPYLLQNILNIAWESGDVFVNGGGCSVDSTRKCTTREAG